MVFFVIVSVLIVGLVLLQNEEGDSLGGLFAGGSNSAFGSRSGNVLTKATYTMVTLFLVISLLLAWLNKSPGDSGVQKAAQMQQAETAAEWWKENEQAKNSEETVPAADTSDQAVSADEENEKTEDAN